MGDNKPHRQLIQEVIEDKKERGEPVTRQPFGLTTDKQRYGDRYYATEVVPEADGGEDKVIKAVQICNAIHLNGIDPEKPGQMPRPQRIGHEHGFGENAKARVRSIWRNRDKYARIAREWTPNVVILWED